MDLDSETNGVSTDPPKAAKVARPKMQRSELSEIMEGLVRENGITKDEDVDVDADADADGEGESPGLDALAIAASEMA